MAKTKNIYNYPIDKNRIERVTYDESPAHVGRWKHSVDFIVPEGIPIKAAAAGVVTRVMTRYKIGGPDKRFDRFGNYIEVRHLNDEYSWYEHLRKGGGVVKPGERVIRGQVIGYSGVTGWVAHLGPHLHFAVLKYGRSVRDFQSLEIVWK